MIEFKDKTDRPDWDRLPGLLRFVVELSSLVYGLKFNRPLVVTAIANETHSPGSKHYQHRAVDLRANNLPASDADWFFGFLQGLFPIFGGTALYEDVGTANAHFHVQV